MKKTISFIMSLLLIFCIFARTANADVGDYEYSESESNNTYSTADKIYSDSTVHGSLSGKYDIDFYRFTISSSEYVSIYCQSSKARIMFGLYDSSKNIITSGSSSYSDGYYYSYTNRTLSADTYYIGISQDTSYSDLSYMLYVDCGDSGESAPPSTTQHKHNYVEIERVERTCITEGYTYYACECGRGYKGGNLSPLGHKTDGWIVESEATCTSDGLKYTKCNVCGERVDIETTPKLGHIETEWIEDKVATCTSDGRRHTDCKRCGKVVKDEVVEAYGHNNTTWTVEKEGSCTEDEVKYETCNDCGEKINTVVTPAPGHGLTFILDAEPAGCEEEGLTAGEMCFDCGKVIVEQKVIPAKGHQNVLTTPGKAPTCTEDGIADVKYCLDCDMEISDDEVIPATGHKIVAIPAKKATYTSTGLTAGKKCSVCGEITVKQKKVAKKKLKKVTISSVKSTKAKQAVVNWKTVSDATGYIVEYSTSKKFTKKTTKKVTVKKAKSKKTTLKKLKSGKKYYVRIRAYKTVNKKTVYGSYSSVKSVKVK